MELMGSSNQLLNSYQDVPCHILGDRIQQRSTQRHPQILQQSQSGRQKKTLLVSAWSGPKLPVFSNNLRGSKHFYFRLLWCRVTRQPPAHARWAQKHVAVSSCKASVITVRVQMKLTSDDGVINPTAYNIVKNQFDVSQALCVRTDRRSDRRRWSDSYVFPNFLFVHEKPRYIREIQVYNIFRYAFLLHLFIPFCHLNHFPFIPLCSNFIYSSVLSIKGGKKLHPWIPRRRMGE